MKAIVKTAKGPGNVAYIDVEHPGKPGPGYILVEVKSAGICGSDTHIYHGTFMHNPPVIMGHEYVGVVVEVGEGVTDFKPGDRISSEVPTECCGKCKYCRTGDIQHCIDRSGMGALRNGIFTKYELIDASVAHHMPECMDDKYGALLEPIATCSHCMELTPINVGDVVVIAGPGPIGIIMAQLAMAEGGQVIVTGTDVDEDRLRIAEKLGVYKTINVQREDGVAAIRDLTEGYGCDVYIDCSGNGRSIATGIEALRCMGRYTQMGVLGKEATVDWDRIATKELKVTGVKCEKYSSWEKAISYVEQGKINFEILATHDFGFDEWEEAFKVAEDKTGLKVLMHPVE